MRKTKLSAQFFCATYPTHAKVFGAFALLAMLSSCSTAAEHVSSQAPRCDYEGPSGICIRIDANAKRVNPVAIEAAYLQAKREVEVRYHFDLLDVPAPVVHVMAVADFAQLHPIGTRLDGDTGGDHGWTDFRTQDITLTGGAVMRHESFHYLLLKAGYPNALNSVHDHAAFDEYRDGIWLPKRAGQSSPELPAQSATAAAPAASATASTATLTR